MSTVNDALRLCERFPVFPCLEDKRPACPRGFKNAAREPQSVVDLWRRYPGPLIGVPTGSVSGIDALDVDPRHGGHDWYNEARDSLPITQINHTRSGGIHLLFRHVEGVRNTAGKIAPGIDTRGEGGFIIHWGGKIENAQQIADWPRWLLKLLNPPKQRRAPPHVPATAVEANARASLMVERAYERVRSAPAGQRHCMLRAAAATLGGLNHVINKTQAQIENDLVELIISAGGEDRSNAERTARWAYEKGTASPLMVGR